ncbi:MAG: hypothetical protein EKK40_11950 [Bradyrhizobiaceae bacterium]|nr:MAG: hypothetical protein EKK40_11950 [Bradyrhizobiaceae bacterium]
MAAPVYFPRYLILAGAALFGMLLALGVHILGQRFGLNLGDLWGTGDVMPAIAAVAWWLVSAVAFVAGYFTAALLHSAASGQLPPRLRQALIGAGVLLLAAAGQAASGPSAIPTVAGVLAAIGAMFLGAIMAFAGAYFALERA